MATNSPLIKQLIEFGLSDKEAKIYLALLELEIATVSEIAKTSRINRSSAYVVIESLKKKGLISVSEDKKIQRYVAVSPEMLLFEAEQRAQQAQTIRNNIGDIVPELKALHKDTKQRPKVKVFEGKQGLINAFEDSLRNKEKVIRVSSSAQDIFKVLPEYFPTYVQKRIKLGITMYAIHPDDAIARKLIEMNPKIDKPMLISPKKYNFPAEVAIYDNKIAYLSPEKEIAIIIESKEMASVMKNIFDLAYQEAKRLSTINNLVGDYKESLSKYHDPTAPS